VLLIHERNGRYTCQRGLLAVFVYVFVSTRVLNYLKFRLHIFHVKQFFHGYFRIHILFTSLLGLLLLSGCNLNSRMSTFKARGPVAEAQLDLFYITLWVVVGLFIAVGGVLLIAVIKFREKKGDTSPLPSHGHGNPLVEIGLIGGSVLLLVVIAVPTLRAIWFTHDLPIQPESELKAWYPGDDVAEGEESNILTVNVIGYQWWWAFEYPQLGITTANELIIPAGKAVKLNLRSVDVIHSFWLPQIAGKVDLIPGRANYMWIQAGDTFEKWAEKNVPEGSEAGQKLAYENYLEDEIHDYYYGQCAEFCGESHARMLFRASVVGDDEFGAWVSDIKTGNQAPEGMSWKDWYANYDKSPEVLTGDVHEGLKLFMGRAKCATCHAVNGNPRALGVAGPNLTHLARRYSLAAGWLNHRTEDGAVDIEQQYKNFVKWIDKTEEVKPGNLMWKANGGGIGELIDAEGELSLLTEEEVHKISIYLQTLK